MQFSQFNTKHLGYQFFQLSASDSKKYRYLSTILLPVTFRRQLTCFQFSIIFFVCACELRKYIDEVPRHFRLLGIASGNIAYCSIVGGPTHWNFYVLIRI